jgi:two-component system response regulator HydG
LERAAALTAGDTLEEEQLLLPRSHEQTQASASSTTEATDAPPTLEALERQHILRVLAEQSGNRERAAAILGISARTLYRKLREYEANAASTSLTAD